MLSDELDSLLNVLENYLEFYQKTAPHVLKRKIRHNFRKGKFHYRTLLVVNKLHDFILPPSLLLKPFLRKIKKIVCEVSE